MPKKSKKVNIITCIDPTRNRDKSIITTAAVKRDGTIHVLSMDEVPTPIFTPKPVDWMEIKEKIEKQELKFSQSAVDSLKDWPRTNFIPLISSKSRPPSGHKRIYRPGAKFTTMNQLVKWLEIGDYTFWGRNRRAFHAGWVRGFQVGYVMWNLRAGNIRKAVKI